MKQYILMAALAVAVCGCDGCSGDSSVVDNSKSDDYTSERETCRGRHHYEGNQEGQTDSEDPKSTNGGEQQEDQIFQCQICQGSGMTLYFDGSIIPCYGCGGQGYISTRQLKSILNQTGSSDDGDEETENISGGYSYIKSEIAMHEENVARLEHQLESIESSVYRTQIEQQIIEERYEIRRLKSLLNGV